MYRGILTDTPLEGGGIMAAAAEITHNLNAYSQPANELSLLADGHYLLVDDIEAVAAERQRERLGAWALMENRREDDRRQGTEAFLPPVDALSTAHAVLATSQQYGEDSPECQERYSGLLLDCQRLVAEWYRKKTAEYFPAVRHVFDGESEEFFSHGLSVTQMTRNALLPMADNPEEESRRVNERVEDATPQILRKKLGHTAMAGIGIRTISHCTYKAKEDYQHDQKTNAEHRGYGGYVPEIDKTMIRDIYLDEETQDRLEVQIGLPGTYIIEEVYTEALSRRGIDVSVMDRTERHGAQFLTKDDPMEFVALLDEIASEWWCTNIFMGEEVPRSFVKDYDRFRREAVQRQEDLKVQAAIIATFVLDLAGDKVDRKLAPKLVEDFVKKMMLDIAKFDESVAEQMFDERTAEGLRQVKQLEAMGLYEEAAEKMQEVEKKAPGGGYCGGDGCGLENVSTATVAGGELAKKLRATAGEKIVKDKVRRCRCGGSVAYAYSSTRVKKYCEKCQSYESKRSVVVA